MGDFKEIPHTPNLFEIPLSFLKFLKSFLLLFFKKEEKNHEKTRLFRAAFLYSVFLFLDHSVDLGGKNGDAVGASDDHKYDNEDSRHAEQKVSEHINE